MRNDSSDMGASKSGRMSLEDDERFGTPEIRYYASRIRPPGPER